MYSNQALRFPPTTMLVVPYGVSVEFAALDYVRVPVGASEFKVQFDFGDGTTATKAGRAGVVDPVAKTYASPGGYTLRIQLKIDNNLWERYSWPVQVACMAQDFAPGAGPLPFVAAVHATFALPGGNRQVIVPIPKASSFGYGSYGDSAGTSRPNMDDLSGAVYALARQFQQSYATGFGRIPVPRAVSERAVFTHLPVDVLPYGTSSCLQADISILEQRFREVFESPSRSDALSGIKSGMDALVTLYSDIRTLGRINVSGGDALMVGDRSIQLGDVQTWHAYATTSVDDSTPLAEVQAGEWRQMTRNFDRELPKANMTSAWFWEATQGISQALDAMYHAMGRRSLVGNAKAVLLADPKNRQCSLRMYDESLQIWAQVTAVKSDGTGYITLKEMATDNVDVAPGNHVAVRAVGVSGVDGGPCSQIAYLFDAARIESSMDGRLFAEHPSFKSFPNRVSSVADLNYESASRITAIDGTVAVGVSSSTVDSVTVGLPAVRLPDGVDSWSSLTPHALLAVFRRKV